MDGVIMTRIFGETKTSGVYTGGDNIFGSKYIMANIEGLAISIHARTWQAGNAICGIYKTDYTLLAKTETVSVAAPEGWTTFNFSEEDRPALKPRESYYLVFNSDTSKLNYVWTNRVLPGGRYKVSYTYDGNLPDPWGLVVTGNKTQNFSIYCLYQERGRKPGEIEIGNGLKILGNATFK